MTQNIESNHANIPPNLAGNNSSQQTPIAGVRTEGTLTTSGSAAGVAPSGKQTVVVGPIILDSHRLQSHAHTQAQAQQPQPAQQATQEGEMQQMVQAQAQQGQGGLAGGAGGQQQQAQTRTNTPVMAPGTLVVSVSKSGMPMNGAMGTTKTSTSDANTPSPTLMILKGGQVPGGNVTVNANLKSPMMAVVGSTPANSLNVGQGTGVDGKSSNNSSVDGVSNREEGRQGGRAGGGEIVQQQSQLQKQEAVLEPWSESTILSSLRKLDEIHTKLKQLRSTLPRMVQPLTSIRQYAAPEEFYEDFRKKAVGACEEVSAFTQLYLENKPIFDRAALSRRANREGIRRWGVHDKMPEGVFEEEEEEGAQEKLLMEKEREKSTMTKEDLDSQDKDKDVKMEDAENGQRPAKEGAGEGEDDEETRLEEMEKAEERKDVSVVLDEFTIKYIDTERNLKKRIKIGLVSKGENKADIKVTLPPPTSFHFTIDVSHNPSVTTESTPVPTYRFLITSLVSFSPSDSPTLNQIPLSTGLHTGILRSIASREKPSNLRLLLEMLASYTNVFEMKCEKCGRLTKGGKVDLPVMRKRIRVVEKEDKMLTLSRKGTGVDLAGNGKDQGITEKGNEEAVGGEGKEHEREKKEKKEIRFRWAAYHDICLV